MPCMGHAQQKERLRDRAWRNSQASSKQDRGNTARKKREAASDTPEEREARLQHMRGRQGTANVRLATRRKRPGYSRSTRA